jgi:hypothetical protein
MCIPGIAPWPVTSTTVVMLPGVVTVRRSPPSRGVPTRIFADCDPIAKLQGFIGSSPVRPGSRMRLIHSWERLILHRSEADRPMDQIAATRPSATSCCRVLVPQHAHHEHPRLLQRQFLETANASRPFKQNIVAWEVTLFPHRPRSVVGICTPTDRTEGRDGLVTARQRVAEGVNPASRVWFRVQEEKIIVECHASSALGSSPVRGGARASSSTFDSGKREATGREATSELPMEAVRGQSEAAAADAGRSRCQ